jgi:hypothetical protein
MEITIRSEELKKEIAALKNLRAGNDLQNATRRLRDCAFRESRGAWATRSAEIGLAAEEITRQIESNLDRTIDVLEYALKHFGQADSISPVRL